MIGRITRVPLREVWKHEERDFSRWLAENIDMLGDAMGMSLSAPERERPAGDFAADLLAEDEDGDPVVIENQLESSDHDHLGKLLTYVAAFNAKTAVWVVREARAEHTAAIAWLNQSASTDFYLFQAEAIRIGDSPPALNLVKIVGPSEQSRSVRDQKSVRAHERSEIREFWEAFLSGKPDGVGRATPSHNNWITISSGVPNFHFLCKVGVDWINVTLEIYHAESAWNKAALTALMRYRAEIESAFGEALKWEPRPGRGAWVWHRSDVGGYRSPADAWTRIHATMSDMLTRMQRAIRAQLLTQASDEADRILAESARA